MRRAATNSFRENLIGLEEVADFSRRFAKYMALEHPDFATTLPKK
jgi:hypothetical protein